MRRRALTALTMGLIALALGCARARPAPVVPPPAGPAEQFITAIHGAMRSTGVERATWGIAIRSLERDETIVELNADALLVPASVLKLVTLGAAVEAVGWDYTFDTTLTARGRVVDGVLAGDLVARGTGDPTIGGPGGEGLSAWIEGVRARGITRVSGRIIGDDDGAQEPLPLLAWAWDDLGYPYGALPGALNFGENAAAITLAPGPRAGTPAVLTVPGGLPTPTIANDVDTGLPDSMATLRPILQPGGLGLRILGMLPATAHRQLLPYRRATRRYGSPPCSGIVSLRRVSPSRVGLWTSTICLVAWRTSQPPFFTRIAPHPCRRSP